MTNMFNRYARNVRKIGPLQADVNTFLTNIVKDKFPM